MSKAFWSKQRETGALWWPYRKSSCVGRLPGKGIVPAHRQGRYKRKQQNQQIVINKLTFWCISILWGPGSPMLVFSNISYRNLQGSVACTSCVVLVQRLWMNLGVKVLFCWPRPPVPAWRHRRCGTAGQGRHQTTSCLLFLWKKFAFFVDYLCARRTWIYLLILLVNKINGAYRVSNQIRKTHALTMRIQNQNVPNTIIWHIYVCYSCCVAFYQKA